MTIFRWTTASSIRPGRFVGLLARDACLRKFDYAFIERLSPLLTRKMVETARRVPEGTDDAY